MEKTQVVNEKQFRNKSLAAKDFKAILMYVLPASESTDEPFHYTTQQNTEERLPKLVKPWWEYILQRKSISKDLKTPIITQEIPATQEIPVTQNTHNIISEKN